MMEYTPDNCENVARQIAESMELEDLIQYVVDDLYAVMLDSQECFDVNVESLGYNVVVR